MARTAAAARTGLTEGDPENLLDWFRANTRLLVIGAVVVIAAALGFWFYTQSRRIRIENAERSLMSAQQALAQNNIPLAQTDLQTIVSRYPGTPAGEQAGLLLARIHYDQGQYQEGIDVLQRVAEARGRSGARPAFMALIGDGYQEIGLAGDAAAFYEAAAEETRFDGDRDVYLSQAARALVAANDTASAVEIWRRLAADQESAVAAEARVRLGELTTAPVRAN